MGVSESDILKPESSRILIVGSDVSVLSARASVAESAGYTPVVLAWPISLPRALEEHTPELLMLSVGPGENWGYELCADLRLVDPAHDLPVLMLVDEAEQQAIERGLHAGADDVVRMQVGDGELAARFAVQLRNRRYREAVRSLQTERDNLKVKATVDPLTQVLNRGALEEALLAELNKGASFAVMFVDLDHFKKINDTFGHDVGDAVLRGVGGHLRRTIRSNDIAGRYGGEEFVVCLSRCDEGFAPKIAERHRSWIEALTFPKGNYPERITASIGVAVFNPNQPDSSLSALLKRADMAVYEAKRGGRNRVVVAPALQRTFEEEKSATLAFEISRTLAEQPAPAAGAANSLARLEAELVRQLNEGISALPAVPAVAIAALRMANMPNVNLSSLAQFVEQDPFTAARFLAVANSPVYYRGFRTASVRDALMRMGLGQVREILAASAQAVALPKYHELLVRHSERATLAGRSALLIDAQLRMNYEPAYLCGLLHNLGEARVLRILADLQTPPEGLRDVERLVEKYHTHAGAQLAEKWNLHSDLVQACALHHEPQHASAKPVKIAILSDLFAELATKPFRPPTDAQTARWRNLGMTDAQAMETLRSLRR